MLTILLIRRSWKRIFIVPGNFQEPEDIAGTFEYTFRKTVNEMMKFRITRMEKRWMRKRRASISKKLSVPKWVDRQSDTHWAISK